MLMLELFFTFFKIGLFTFGGGYAMIPMIQQEVLGKNWTTQETLIDFIAISESTPGPFAINIATFIGMEQAGIWGAVCTTLGVVLPSFLVILVVVRFFMAFQENRYVKATLYGLRAAVIGLIGAAAFSIFVSNVVIDLGSLRLSWKALIIAVAAFGLILWKKNLHPIVLVLFSGSLGILFQLLLPSLP